jgi:hypothetical protein
VYRAGLEAGFLTPSPFLGWPAQNQQITFARIRIILDPFAAGTYTIVHPYGVETMTVTAADVTAAKPLRFVKDIGIGGAGNFTPVLAGPLGPWLMWDTGAPIVVGAEQFVGDPTIAHPVIGSPFGTNFLKITGPAGANLGGPPATPNVIQTNLFNLAGQIFTGPIATPLHVERATYNRNATTTNIDVFATAAVNANVVGALSALQVSGTGILPTPMTTDGAGNFFAHISLPNPPALPATLTVTNVADVPASFVTPNLVDEVTVTQANYDPVAHSLTIQASSLDTLVPPTLSYGITPLGAGGLLTVPGVLTPPPAVTVISGLGGSDTKALHVVVPVPPAPVLPATGLAEAGNPASPAAAGTPVTFLAQASGGSGPYEYEFWLNGPGTAGVWQHVQFWSPTSTWTWTPTAADAGVSRIALHGRSVGSTVPLFDVEQIVSYTVTVAPTGLTVGAFPAASQVALSPVLVSATPVGGAGPFEYDFWLNGPGTAGVWQLVQDYSNASTWVWNTTALDVGASRVAVHVRNAGSPLLFDVETIVGYSVTP